MARSTKIQKEAENGFEQEETEQAETQAKKGYRTSPGGKILCCLCYLLFKSFSDLFGGNRTLMQEPEFGFMGRPPIGIPILRSRRAHRYRKKQRTDLNSRKRSKQRLRQSKDTEL